MKTLQEILDSPHPAPKPGFEDIATSPDKPYQSPDRKISQADLREWENSAAGIDR